MCSWMAITSGQLGAHLTSTTSRFISEQEQGVMIITNSFQVCEKVFLSKLHLPSSHQSDTQAAYSFSALNIKSFIKCYIGFYFYGLIYNRDLHSFLYRKPQNLG